ncbi:MAG TPA: heavy metal-binding domain-containing protein [Solirubrobacteraceae bacterium]|nr:heavy metal-binding domain-containing protein [Solirubrobacteraceae bacterium]
MDTDDPPPTTPDDRGGQPAGDERREREQAESLTRIEAGGIPMSAERRLKVLSTGNGAFTSGLSVGDYALLDRLGPRPLAQVLGASVHQVGWQFLPPPNQWGGELFCELDMVARAWDQARRRALDRLTEEAQAVGADAVVGVNLRRGEHDWAAGSVDFVVAGTAVRLPGSPGGGWPILSDLSVADYWKLQQSGYAPVGLVAATAVFFVSPSSQTQWTRYATTARNQELTDFTRGFYAARETALRYISSQADSNKATGIVGVRIDQSARHESYHVAGYAQPQTGGVLGTRQQLGGFGARQQLGGLGGGLGGGQQQGSDQERSGLAITLHAVGTAIREVEDTPQYPPETVISQGVTADDR